MQTTRFLFLFISALILFGCSSGKKQESTGEDASEIILETVEESIELPPLEEGEVLYKNKEPFGEIIELTGEQQFIDTVIFKISETQMLVKDGILGMKNRVEDRSFMRIGIPGMEFMGIEGIHGKGPDEFMYPSLAPTPDPDLLAYIMENTNEKIYRWYKNGDIIPYERTLFNSKFSFASDIQLVNLTPDNFIYVSGSRTGKSIFRTTVINDSIQTREVFNLGLNPKRKSWTNYIGDFVVNPKLNRMAYAYKYFKVIKFMDLEGQTVRTIDFNKEEFDESTNYVVDGMDRNVTHYWGGYAGEKYMYFLYSGRTPVEVSRDNNKKNYYIHVEKYDWNGNPVAKYKLDRWGYFTVDEKNNQIYLASTSDDDPFFVYTMPE